MRIVLSKSSFCCNLLCLSLFLCASLPALSGEKLSAFDAAFSFPSNKYESLLTPLRAIGDLKQLSISSEVLATNIISWQLPSGGFSVHDHNRYLKPWNKIERRSVFQNKLKNKTYQDLANFDDLATVSEIRFLASVYASTKNGSLKVFIRKSVEEALNFIFDSQHKEGSWPQVYPERAHSAYSNLATINDDAMVRIMVLLSDIYSKSEPFNTDLISDETALEIPNRLSRAMQSLLSAQIEMGGVLTIWPAQYEPKSFKPRAARIYEAAGKSARESVAVVALLLNWPYRSNESDQAIAAAIKWFQKNAIRGAVFERETGAIKKHPSRILWYRFYEIDKDTPFFGDREKGKVLSLSELSLERRTGYAWAGNWAEKLLEVLVLEPQIKAD